MENSESKSHESSSPSPVSPQDRKPDQLKNESSKPPSNVGGDQKSSSTNSNEVTKENKPITSK